MLALPMTTHKIFAQNQRDVDDFGFDKVEIDTCKYKLIDILPWKDGNVAYHCEIGE